MAKPRVKDLVPRGDLPPAAVVERFITFFINERDLKLAACKASLMPEWGERLYRVPKIRSRIDHKILLIDVEEAKVKAKANLLTVPMIDSVVYEELKSKKNGHVRMHAAKLAYQRVGLIRDGEFVGVQAGGGVGQSKTYGQIHTTTLRRTMTEEVVQSSETPAIPPPAPARVETLHVEDY